MGETQRSWLRLLRFSLAASMATALGVAILLAGTSLAFAGSQGDDGQSGEAALQSFSGMITDSTCGARHIRNSGMSSADCVRECVRKGASYTLVDGDRVYFLRGNRAQASQFAGVRATVTGDLDGDTIQVKSIRALSP